ncbi:EF-hand domain-containing protein [Halomonas sp. KRD171]|uniref:EF-hand domain-containing protein n=1 Tax=Halomonas sp. KRD171 TaxID=2729726 RepID=UPI0019D112EE|nr:EF-hand domain-containing protein [Halomonas sp. KRD171]
MAQQYKTGLIITGDASGGIRAIKATGSELGKLNQGFDRGGRQSKQFGADAARAGRQLSAIDQGASDASRGLAVLRTNVAGVAAAMATAFGAGSIINQAKIIADTDSLAKSIGMATGSLQAWDYAAKQAGLAGGQMGDILKDITERIGEFTAEGTGEAVALFENLNLNIGEMKRLAPDQQLLRIADAISTLETRGEQISYLERLGSDATLLLPLLDNNAAKLREFTNEAQMLGVAMSQMDIDSAIEANRAMVQLTGTMEGFTNQIVADVGPALASTVGELTNFIQEAGGADAILETAADAATMFAVVMGGRLVGALTKSTQGMISDAAAAVAQAKAHATATTAARAKAAETLRVAQADQAAASRALANGHAIAAATGNTTLRTKAITQMAAANQRAIAAEAAHTAAVNANSAAMARGTVAAQGMAAATRTGASALALIGGPAGAALIAGAGLYYFREELGLTDDKMQGTIGTIESLGDSFISEFGSMGAELVGGFRGMRGELIDLDASFIDLKASAVESFAGIVGSSADVINLGLIPIQHALNALDQGFANWINRAAGAFESAGAMPFGMTNLFGEQVTRLRSMADDLADGMIEPIGISTAALETNAQSWRSQADAMRATADELRGNVTPATDDLVVTFQTLDQWLDEIERGAGAAGNSLRDNAPDEKTIAAWEKYNDQLRDNLAASRDPSAVGAANRELDKLGVDDPIRRAITVGLALQEDQVERQKELQKEAADAARQAASEAERAYQQQARAAEQSAKQQADALRSIQHEMDPLTAEHDKYVERINVLDQALSDGTLAPEAYGDAFRWAAEQYTRAATGAEEYEKQTESLISTYDRHNQRAHQLRDALEQINQRYRAGEIDGDQYSRMVGGIRDEMQQLALEAAPISKELARSWEEAANRINETFGDAFTGAYDSFEDFGDKLMDGVKRLIGEITYQATLEPIVIGVTTQARGALGIPGTGGQQGGGLDLSSMSSLKNGWSAIKGGVSNVAWTGAGGSYQGTGWANAATEGTGVNGFMGGSTANFSGMQGLASAGAGFAGSYAGRSVFGEGRDNDILETAGTLVGTYFGGPLGAAAGSFIGSALASLDKETKFSGRFGTTATNDPSQYARSGKDGVFEHQDSGTNFYGQSALGYTGFLDQGTKRLQRAGVGEDKGWAEELTDAAVVRDNLAASLARTTDELEAMQAAVQGLESSSSTAGELVEFALNERPRAALEALGGDFGAFVRILDGGIEQVVAQAQVAQQAHTLLTDSAERLGLQFNIAGGYAYEAATEVAQLAGGVENLSSLQQSYYQNYFSDAERAAHLTEDLTQALNGMGLQMPETREGFRALIESQKLATQAGRENYTQLLQLESAFAQLTPAIEETGSAAIDASGALREREQLERQLLQLQGDTAELRRRDLLDIDESNRALQQRIWSIQDERAAQEAAERAQQERIRAIEQESQAWARARDQLAGFSNSIDGWLAQLDGTEKGMGTPRERLEASDADFWAQYEKALQGDRNAQQGITQSADRYIANLQEMYASSDPAVDGIAEIRDAMERLPEMLTPEQFLADEFKNALGEQTVSLTNVLDLNGDGTISAIERSITAEWDATQQLNGVLSSEMELLGTTVLTESQIRSALKPHATDAEINRLINNVDKNGDGIISRQELTNARLSDLAGGIAGALEPMFSSIDLDANDLIDYDEFRRAFAGMATDGELRRIFNKLDVDGNGQISRLEAINANTSTIDQANGDGLKVSFGRNHNPSGLIDMAYNWGTKWGQMGAPAFRGAGGGDLDYEPPGETSGGSGSGGSSSGGGSAGGSSSGGSGTSGIPAGAQSWIDQFSANEPNSVQFLSVDYLLKHWRNHDTEIRKTGQALYELEALGARMPSGDTTLRNLTPSWKFFANGGYTGPGGKYDPAGIVHAGEVVWSQADIARAGGVGAVESMRIGGISAPPLPKIQMQLPMPEMPPLPQFPALSNNDVLQVLNDVRKELQETRKENKRLLELIGENTGDTVAAVEQAAARSEQQRDDQLDELETLSRYSKTEIRTT